MRADFMSLVLRLGFAGTLFISHGISKLSKISGGTDSFPDPLGIGSGWSFTLTVFAEVVCTALVFMGFFTRLASIVIVFQMAVIAFMVHGSDGMPKQELPFLFAVAFLAIAIAGGGKFSLGNLVFGNKIAQL